MNHPANTPHDSFPAAFGLLLAATVLLASCSVEQKDPEGSPPVVQEQSILSDNTRENVPAPAEVIPEAPPEEAVTTRHYVATPQKTVDHVQQIAYKVSPDVIAALNKVMPIYDTALYNAMTVSYFTALSNDLNGRPFFVESSDSLLTVITEILSTRLNDGTDIVFLIDKTASMNDDIENVKSGMKNILAYLKNFDNVKLGIAAYGDKNWHHDLWYNRLDLGYGTEKIEEFMESFVTIGNPDVPESVNDAIVRTVEEMNWTAGNRRLMLVIGDAPSQLPPLTTYTQQEVVEKCREKEVAFNLYPIVLATGLSRRVDPVIRKGCIKIYPNPVNTVLHLDVKDDDHYSYEVHDISGRIMRSGQLERWNYSVPTSDLAPGNYLVQVHNADQSKYDSMQILVQH